MNGRVYETAGAEVGTTNIDFGIVHVGDVVGPQAVQVSNIAPVAGLNDDLTGSIGGAGGAFEASGDLGAGLTAGESDDSSLLVSLDTTLAGSFSDTAQLDLFSSNADLADLALFSGPIALTGTVNNYADASLSLFGGLGLFSGSGNLFSLNFGNVFLGADRSATLAVVNDVAGPADDLSGTIVASAPAPEFSYTSLGNFSGLGAGRGYNFDVAFNASALGGYSTELLLSELFGSNASGYSASIGDDITLLVLANVVNNTNPIPVPGTLLLLLGPGLLVWRFAARWRTV